MFDAVAPTPAEVAARQAGDDVLPVADVVMDRAFTLAAPPDRVWPWIVQLGKQRAGWYLPRSIERFLPAGRRAIRHVDDRWQQLAVGDIIPDYGGTKGYFEVNEIVPARTLVYFSRRGHTSMTWSIVLDAEPSGGTRLRLRLRLAPVRHARVAGTLGGFFDLTTIAGLAAGLEERLRYGRTGTE